MENDREIQYLIQSEVAKYIDAFMKNTSQLKNSDNAEENDEENSVPAKSTCEFNVVRFPNIRLCSGCMRNYLRTKKEEEKDHEENLEYNRKRFDISSIIEQNLKPRV